MKRFSQGLYVKENVVTLASPAGENRAWNFLLITFVSMILFTAFSILGGCTGGGGGGTKIVTDDTTDDASDTEVYIGSAKVSGTIKLSYLSSSDSALVDADDTTTGSGRVLSRSVKALDTNTEAVKLYVVGTDGEMLDTGISCSLTDLDSDGDREYSCDDVKDGINYIVRYLKLNSETGKALELKTSAHVPAGAGTQDDDGTVSPKTSVIVEALVKAILNATDGADIDDELVNTIIASVKEVIEILVQSGQIQIPSMVVDVDATNLDELLGEDTQNDNLDNAAGMVLADEDVEGELEFLSATTQSGQFSLASIDTDEEKEALINKVFKELLKEDNGGLPDPYMKFFTWHYINNKTITPRILLNALINGIPKDSIASGLPAAAIPGLTLNVAASSLESPITVSNAFNKFTFEISIMHLLLKQLADGKTLDSAQKEALSQFPAALQGLFPLNMPELTLDSKLVMPQGIALVIYFDEVYLGDIFGGNHDLYEWNEMSLFISLGIIEYAKANPTAFTGIEFFGLELEPGSVWVDTANSEYEALIVRTELIDLNAFVNLTDPSVTDQSGYSITLYYPKSNSTTGGIALRYFSESDYDFWGLDPRWEAEMDGATSVDLNRVVSDFVSGTYTIVIKNASGTVITQKDFQKTIYRAKVKLVSPMPNSAGMTTFSANVDPKNIGENTHAKITVSWKAPDLDLAPGVIMFYDLGVGQSICDEYGGNCNWNQIWSTWNVDKRIYTTSFTVPEPLPIDQNNFYNINVNVNFFNKETGEYLGRGKNAYTQFRVGNAVDLNATFKLKGSLNIGTDANSNPLVDYSTLKVALIKETQNSDGSFSRTYGALSSALTSSTNYSLSLPIRTFFDTNGAYISDTWFNLVLVEDLTDSLVAGSSVGNTTLMYWPDYSSSSLWFDSWGGILKVGKETCTTSGCFSEQTVIVGGEEITGPQFFIGTNTYTQMDPLSVTPVSAADLAATFSLSGTATINVFTDPVVALTKSGYDETIEDYVEKVIALHKLSGTGTLSYNLTNIPVREFFDAGGHPTYDYFEIVLVNDDASSTEYQVNVGEPIPHSYVDISWVDWSEQNFWFDTWRGEKLYIGLETYDSGSGNWTFTEKVIPDVTSATGPSLSDE